LDLSGNQFTTLPAQLGELKNLTDLDLSHNYQLKDLPKELLQLSLLQRVNLQGNYALVWQTVCPLLAQAKQRVEFTTDEYIETVAGTLYVLLRPNQLLGVLPVATPSQLAWLQAQKELDCTEDFILPTEQAQLRQLLPQSQWKFSPLEDLDYSNVVGDVSPTFAQKVYTTIKDLKTLSNTDYGSLAGSFVFAHCFEGAIWAGERYVASGGKEISLLSNLAMGYLCNGDYEKAKAIYAQYKNEKRERDGKTGKEIFLGDLRAVAEAKVPAKKPADVEKMIRFLEE
jgi:hypothetical protein